MKVQSKYLKKEQKIEILDSLYTAAGSLSGRAAMKLFLRDLLTESERIMLGRRIVIARKLIAGESYTAVQNHLGASHTTIAKVERWLSDQMPGYEKALAGLEREFKKRGRRYEQKKILAGLKRKYPLHFLFFPSPFRKKK